MEFINEGPYKIIEVHTNGTVRIKRGSVTERINIRLLGLYNSKKHLLTLLLSHTHNFIM